MYIYNIIYIYMFQAPGSMDPPRRGVRAGGLEYKLFLRNLSFWTAPGVLLPDEVPRCP